MTMISFMASSQTKVLTSLGVTEDMLDGIANATIILKGGYETLNHDEIVEILRKSL